MSNAADVEAAVAGASKAFPAWSGLTMKARAGIMLKVSGGEGSGGEGRVGVAKMGLEVTERVGLEQDAATLSS